MTIDERSRHHLHNRLEDVLGSGALGTLMEHLPVGWADVANKRDLDHLEERMNGRIEGLDTKSDLVEPRLLATFRGELVTAIAAQTRTIALAMIGSILTTASLAFATARSG